MPENAKPIPDGLRKWLIIDTILSAIFISIPYLYLLSACFSSGPACLMILTGIFVMLCVHFVPSTVLIITSWRFWKREMRKKAKTWSFVALGISILLLFIPLIYYLSLLYRYS